MTSIISPFSKRVSIQDRLHQKFVNTPIESDNDMVFLNCEKDGKIISMTMTRRNYNLRKKQIANGLISDTVLVVVEK